MTRPHRTVTNRSELDSDLLSQIAGRINCLRDFIIFGAVCRWWRSVASPENFNKSTKVPWLLLDQDHGDHSLRKFLNLSKDLIYRINLPKEKRYVYSSKGWFLNVENHLRLSLLNPFSLSRIDLPHLESKVLLNFALSSSPSIASDFMILIAYCDSVMRDKKLAFWKNGDRKWTDLDLKFPLCNLNFTFHNGRFYIVDRLLSGEEFVVHEIVIQNSKNVSISSKSFDDPRFSLHICNPCWIVGSSQMLMVVTWRLDDECIGEDGECRKVNYLGDEALFLVQEIDFEKGEYRKVSDLGDKALFLGNYSFFLVDVSNESRFKSNHIYFAENFQLTFIHPSGGSVGVYSMIDGSYKPLFNEGDSGYRCSSQWIEPRL